MRDGVEIISSCYQRRYPIVVPEIAEMLFNLVLHTRRNICSFVEGLQADLLNDFQPRLQLFIFVTPLRELEHFCELIHHNGKDSHSAKLNNYSEQFLADRTRMIITVSDCTQRRQHKIGANYQLFDHSFIVSVRLSEFKTLHEISFFRFKVQPAGKYVVTCTIP